MPSASDIGLTIAKRRHLLGLSQEELAARVGVIRDTVSKWETGKNFPHRHLGKLEQVLGIDLAGDAGPEPLEPRDEFERELLAQTSLPNGVPEDLVRRYRAQLAAENSRRQRAG